MPGLFGWLFGPKVELDSLRFDFEPYQCEGDFGRQRVWFSEDRSVGIGLELIRKRPNLPGVKTQAELQVHMETLLAENEGSRPIEFEVLTLGEGLRGMRFVFRQPLPEGGAVYVGSLTFPFERFSFTLKAQCEEAGMTGVREAVLTDRALRDGTIPVGDDGPDLSSFSPYDSAFDAEFPDHPLTKLRSTLSQLQQTVYLMPEIKHEPSSLPAT